MVDGGSIAPGEFVDCVLLEVDDHLMGGPRRAHHESMERVRQRIKFGKWHWLLQDGPPFFGGRDFTQLSDRSFKFDMTRFIQERQRPISLQRERCLYRSAEGTEVEEKALRAVASSLSWVARQCRPDEAGTASTLQGSVSRAVVKDLSDANRAVNRLKRTMRSHWLTFAQWLFRTSPSTQTVQTVRHREDSWSVSPRPNFTNKDQQSCHPCPGHRTK